ncbi:hypothetical protein Tco_1092005 [Tanacetum coccineum]|uniref:Uncharacterized protein n=1 Tax=Tanacetum coccineum TaxID=301880 RepID=A0ABQ5IAZ8_9ASTR
MSHFKGMSYKDIRPIFERVWDQNNAFVSKDSDIENEVMKRHEFNFQQKSSKKRSREVSDEDNAKKQKLEDDAEKKELRDSMYVVPRDDIPIDVESLANKYPIARCPGSTHTGTRKDYNLISWRLFDSCGIHMLLMHTGISIHMMIEKKYPFTQEMLSRMLSRRLDVDQESEMAFELLRSKVQFRRTSLTGFPAQSIRSSNAIALDSPYLLVLITGTSQSRQHESRKSPTKSLFDVGSRRISIVTVNTKEYHSDVLAIITRIMRRTY